MVMLIALILSKPMAINLIEHVYALEFSGEPLVRSKRLIRSI
jgi:hypothetical protein